MKKHYKLLSFLIILCGVLLGYFVTPIKNVSYEIDVSGNFFKTLNFDFTVFIKIFINNLIVGLLLAIGGYFTSGVLTVLTLLWNGLILGTLFTLFHNLNISLELFTSMFIIHGIPEFYGLILFSSIGYKGYNFYTIFFKTGRLEINLKVKEFKYPTLLLIFAAIIETILITNY
ncbi:MAG: stage II sporulation protein M [Urechidicola sp.]|nr:stage II sporulation protein M [Urechidicola sp.]